MQRSGSQTDLVTINQKIDMFNLNITFGPILAKREGLEDYSQQFSSREEMMEEVESIQELHARRHMTVTDEGSVFTLNIAMHRLDGHDYLEEDDYKFYGISS